MENILTEINSDTKVKYITSEQSESPLLKNSYGSLNNLLKTVLVTGFNEKIILSYTIDLDTGIATIELPINHGFVYNQVIEISGCEEDTFNGQFRVLESRGLKICIKNLKEKIKTSPEIISSVLIKVAPLGYTLSYENEESGTMCFKNKSVNSPAIIKVIDKLPPNGYLESWVKYGRVVIGQEIDSEGNFIDNVKTPFWHEYPDAELSGNGVSADTGIHGFAKWDYASHTNYDFYEMSTSRGTFPTDWRIIGDDKTFYLMIRTMGKGNYSFNIVGYGNFISEDPYDTKNICLQSRYGPVRANEHWNYNFVRTNNNFGAFDWDYGGHLYANIYGSVKNQSRYGIYKCAGLYLSGNYPDRPWLSSGVNSLNPISGEWITSLIYIKDSDNYIRGYHRGIRNFYGRTDISDGLSGKFGDLALRVQAPTSINSGENQTMMLLFSLRDWEEV